MEFRAMRRFKQQLSKEECVEILKSAPRGVIAMNGEKARPSSTLKIGDKITIYFAKKDIISLHCK